MASQGLTDGHHPEQQGWDQFVDVGAVTSGSLYIEVWRRQLENGRWQYMLVIGDANVGRGERLVVDGLPKVMDLLAKWAPAVQAAEVAKVLSDLQLGSLDAFGLVELVAARAAWGAEENRGDMERDYRTNKAREASRASEADAKRAAARAASGGDQYQTLRE